MAGSTDPTDGEVLAALQYNVPRISQAQKEIVRRLQVNMPGKIAYLNTLLSLPTGKGIQVPDSYLVAPSANLTDKYLNSMLCSVAASISANGARQFKTTSQVVVYSVDRKIEHATQVEDAFDRCGVAIGILNQFLTGCVDPQGRKVWRALECTGYTLTLPEQWGEVYSGSTAYFTMVQDESCQCWS